MRLAVLLVALVACTRSYADEPAGKRFERDMMARFHMHESYALFATIERALLEGRLDDARRLAQGIGAAPDEPDFAAWQPQSAAVRERALALANATGVSDACRRAAGLAEACAGCHAAASAGPELAALPALPPHEATVEARMARHLWAAERIHEGVIAAADSRWRAGLAVLAQAPLAWPGDRARGALASQVQRLARQALDGAVPRTGEVAASASRARVYGELLVRCAACHALARQQN